VYLLLLRRKEEDTSRARPAHYAEQDGRRGIWFPRGERRKKGDRAVSKKKTPVTIEQLAALRGNATV